jgi:hypothetical protein
MPSSRLQPLYPDRRRRRLPGGAIALILLLALGGLMFFLSTLDTEKPTGRMEQDVTDALPKS